MNSYLLNRSLGSISSEAFQLAQTTRLVHALESAPGIRFSSSWSTLPPVALNGKEDANQSNEEKDQTWAHKAGVNTLAVDQHEGRYLISGGADSSIYLWDLEQHASTPPYLYRPAASVTKPSHADAHTHGLTSLSIYPHDPTPTTLLSTSYDTTLKLSSLRPDTSTILPIHTFPLDSIPYTHALSPLPSSPLLIAVGTSNPSIRLLDLRSGLATHALPGHTSSVLSVQWSPRNEHILASASTDSRVFLWDVRRAGNRAAFASLDMDDAVGVVGNPAQDYQPREPFSPSARAHNGPVNGVRFTPDGNHIVTCGHDARIRVWDASTGANMLVHFGPRIRNSRFEEMVPLLLPSGLVSKGKEVLFWANDDAKGEVCEFDLHEGTLLKRMRVPGLARPHGPGQGGVGGKKTGGRINNMVWRANAGAGAGVEMYSAHGDGKIRGWASRTEGDVLAEKEERGEADEDEENEKKRKRDVLGEVWEGLTKRPITFT